MLRIDHCMDMLHQHLRPNIKLVKTAVDISKSLLTLGFLDAFTLLYALVSNSTLCYVCTGDRKEDLVNI